MLLFKRHRKNIIEARNHTHDALSQQWENTKRKLACYLQQQSALLSNKSRKAFLILFTMLFSAGSIVIIINATVNRKSVLGTKQISKPSSTKGNALVTKPDSVITQEEYKRVELFKTYLLQLKGDSVNKEKFDSIIQQRPQLLDSIALFEKMYLSQ